MCEHVHACVSACRHVFTHTSFKFLKIYFCLVTKRALFYKLSVLIIHHSYLTQQLFQSSYLAYQVQTVSHQVGHDDVFWWFLCHECKNFLRHCLDLENTTGNMFVCKNATTVSTLHPPHCASLAAGVVVTNYKILLFTYRAFHILRPSILLT